MENQINYHHMVQIEPIGQVFLHSPTAAERKSEDQRSHQKGCYRIVQYTIENMGEHQMIFHQFPNDIYRQYPPFAFLQNRNNCFSVIPSHHTCNQEI